LRVLTFEQIKELIELVGAQRLQGLEVERSGFRLRIDGQAPAPVATAAPAAPPAPAAAPSSAPAPATPAPAAAPAAPATGAAAGSEDDIPSGAHIVESPIVGTFYRQPSPDQPVYVEVGDRVKKGQVLCIVEAMKLMNEIESEVDGTVVKVIPQNAQPVEYGEPLFAIQAD
jgi:acetyl-CoA carboxylase biotin carboxyl carrier protein